MMYVFLNFNLFLQARLYHILGVFEERNHVSAELKRLEDQYVKKLEMYFKKIIKLKNAHNQQNSTYSKYNEI